MTYHPWDKYTGHGGPDTPAQSTLLREAAEQGGAIRLKRGQHRAARKLDNYGLGTYKDGEFIINEEGRSYTRF